jgi:L-alanine-DL-glutamate epimerase-like enolase superfamily enzyme
MKITGLKVQVFKPTTNVNQQVTEWQDTPIRQNGVARIYTDVGIEGVVHTHGENVRALMRLWQQARGHIEGQDPMDRGKIEHILAERYRWPSRVLGALDYGLWDIYGKAFNQPVYKLLGAHRDKILAYASTVHHRTDEEYLETVMAAKEKGFKAIKIHPYCVANDDIRLIQKVRKVVGDDTYLMIDCQLYPGFYTREEALRVGRVLDDLKYWWFEDPLPKDDLEGLAKLTAACQIVQIRSADRVESLQEYGEMIRRRCMDILAGPPGIGITALMKIAALAEANYMNMEPHDFGGGTASLHVGLACRNTNFYEQAAPEGFFNDLAYPGVYEDPIRIDGEGYVHGPTKPGLGFGIDAKAAGNVAVETTSTGQVPG